MLKALNLKKQYKPKNGQVVNALDDVSIDFAETGMVFILGKSGSGKSTLLNVLGGLDKYDSGEVIVKGKSSKDFSQADFDSYRNTFIGFIFQEYNILQEFSVEKNIGLALELQGKKADKEAINALIKEVDLEGYGKRKPNTLSGGQKQRVAIARALVKNPEIIMADEPTGALDSKTGAQVLDTLKKLSKEKLVIVVSHDREFAEYYGDRIIELSDGKIISDQFKHEIKPKNSNGIEIVDDKVLTIKKGTKLTSDNLDEINSFLLNQNEDIVISVDDKANKEFKKYAKINDEGNKETFINTTNEDVKLKDYDGNVKLIRSKLPMKDSFKMGASGLKTKRFRLVLTILLSALAFGMFGLADTMASYNKVENTVQSMLDSNIDYASFDKDLIISEGSYKSVSEAPLNENDCKMLTEKFGINFLPVYSLSGNYKQSYYIENFGDQSKFNGLSLDRIYGFVEGNYNDITSFGSLIGTAPENNDEIVITRYLADSFLDAGYKDLTTDTKTNILDVADLIGLNISVYKYKFKIVGILDTNFDYNRFEKIKNKEIKNISDMMLQQEYNMLLETSMHTLAYLNKGFYNEMLNNGSIKLSNRTELSFGMYVDDLFSTKSYATSLYNENKLNDIIFFDNSKTKLGNNEFIISCNYLYQLNGFFDASNDELLKEYYNNRFPDGYLSFNDYYNLNIYDLFFYYCDVNSKYENARNYFNTLVRYYDVVDYDFNPKDGTKWNPDYKDQYESSVPYDMIDSLKTEFEEMYNEYLNSFYSKYIVSNTLKSEMRYGIFKDLVNASYSKIENYSYDEYINILADVVDGTKFYQYSINASKSDIELVNKMANYFLKKNINFFSGNTYDCKQLREIYHNYELVGINFNYDDDNRYGNEWAVVLSENDPLYKKVIDYAGNFTFVIGKISDNSRQTLRKLVKFNYEENDVRYRLNNSVMESVENVNDFIETASKVFLYVGIGFAVFASLLLLNFISISISYKKREIGILRAIGARGMDVFKIFFSEAFIIALINFVLAFIGCFLTCFFLNKMFRDKYGFLITILHVGIRQFVLVLGVSILVAIISSFIPVYITAHKKPIDAIRSAE